MNKDTVAGSVKETGGKVRSAVDSALGDKKGEALGKIDQATGAAQKNYGEVKDAVKKAANDTKDAANDAYKAAKKAANE